MVFKNWTEKNSIEENYKICNDGTIYSNLNKRYLSPSKTIDGYLYLTLKVGKSEYKKFYVHRLVAYYYCERGKFRTDVNHKDGDKNNNSSPNLEWVTKKRNTKHAWESGLMEECRRISSGTIFNEDQAVILEKAIRLGLKAKELGILTKTSYATVNSAVKRLKSTR